MARPQPPDPGFVFAVGMISSAAVGYEILLLRLLPIIQWYHFTSMIISLALLGYGASGTFLSFVKPWVCKNVRLFWGANALLQAVTAWAAIWIVQHVPFLPPQLLWDWRQSLYLAFIFFLFFTPFFFAASCIGSAIYLYRDFVNRIYGADLLGAALGVVLSMFGLHMTTPLAVLKLLNLVGIGSGLLVCRTLLKKQRLASVGTIALVIAWVAFYPSGLSDLRISPYKNLSVQRQVAGTKIIKEVFHPLGMLTVVKNQQIPFRHAPGLSLSCAAEPPEQLGVFVDGDGFGVINRFSGDRNSLAYLSCLPSALPYALNARSEVLVVGAGGGTQVAQALYYGAKKIDALEIHPGMIALVTQTYAAFCGGLFQRPEVSVYNQDVRTFTRLSQDAYDLITLGMMDDYAASASGLYGVTEDFTYTVEGLKDLIKRLKPNGVVAITRWLKMPPRDSLKLVATARDALMELNTNDARRHLAMIRGWKTSTLLIKPTPFVQDEINGLVQFCAANAFDPIYYTGIDTLQVNRVNRLKRPIYYEAVSTLLNPEGSKAKRFQRQYKYHIKPAWDNRPYFNNFFRWRLLPELFGLRASGGLGLMEWGYLVLITTLVLAVLGSMLLLAIPLYHLRKDTGRLWRHRRFLLYFFCIGLAFLFIEMAFIQRFQLYIGHHQYAAATILFVFLVFAGLGSLSGRYYEKIIAAWWENHPLATVLIASALTLYMFMLPWMCKAIMPASVVWRALIALLLVAPLAFFMGMPFAQGVRQIAHKDAELIPLAWAVNGCATVIAATLATLMAISWGFLAVLAAATSLYIMAAFCYPR